MLVHLIETKYSGQIENGEDEEESTNGKNGKVEEEEDIDE